MKKTTLFIAAFCVAFTMNAQIVFSDDFNAETTDSTVYEKWESIDQDGDGNFWEVADMLDYATNNAPAHPMQSQAADSDSWEGTPFMPDNFLITKDPINLTNVTGTTIEYLVGSYQINGTFIGDQYSVYLTASNDPAVIVTETPITTRTVGDDAPCDQPDGSASAAVVTLDASAFDGQVVYLTFRHYDTFDENSVIIDDVVVDGVLSVGDESFSNFNYFVDANNQLQLSANEPMEKIAVYNIIGQEIITKKLSNTKETIDLSSLNSGVYVASVSINGLRKSIKIVKK